MARIEKSGLFLLNTAVIYQTPTRRFIQDDAKMVYSNVSIERVTPNAFGVMWGDVGLWHTKAAIACKLVENTKASVS